jgi:hypothetical protein
VRVDWVADFDGQLADPRDHRLKRRDQRQHDLAARWQLELAGASLGPGAQSSEQLAGGLATRVPMALEKRR